jgi:hypothetical protein
MDSRCIRAEKRARSMSNERRGQGSSVTQYNPLETRSLPRGGINRSIPQEGQSGAASHQQSFLSSLFLWGRLAGVPSGSGGLAIRLPLAWISSRLSPEPFNLRSRSGPSKRKPRRNLNLPGRPVRRLQGFDPVRRIRVHAALNVERIEGVHIHPQRDPLGQREDFIQRHVR